MNNIEQYKTWKNEILEKHVLYKAKCKELEELNKKVTVLQKDIEDRKLLQAFFNKIINSKQMEVMNKVINIVSYGLQTILEDSTISLKINETLRRNQKFYTFTLKQGELETPIQDAVGGGLVNLISFLLHVVILAVSSNRRLLILDESFANLSREYRENMGQFLQLLVKQTGVQLIMVSHQDELNAIATNLYELQKVNNKVRLVGRSK